MTAWQSLILWIGTLATAIAGLSTVALVLYVLRNERAYQRHRGSVDAAIQRVESELRQEP